MSKMENQMKDSLISFLSLLAVLARISHLNHENRQIENLTFINHIRSTVQLTHEGGEAFWFELYSFLRSSIIRRTIQTEEE